MTLLTNVAYTTPLDGAIRLGRVEEVRGKRLPKKDDFFTLTALHKVNGEWAEHDLHKKLLEAIPSNAEKKLRAIPVHVVYASPELNASERYEAYDTEMKRVVCAGDGEKAKRLNDDGTLSEVSCPGRYTCEFGQRNATRCGLFGRALFNVDGQSDRFSAFILRSGSYNGATSIRTRLEGLKALFGEKLPFVPLKLIMRTKSSPGSMNSAFYYADLEVNGTLVEVAKKAAEQFQAEAEAGINRREFEEQMLRLRLNSGFEDHGETFEDREEFLDPDTVVIDGTQEQGGEKSNSAQGGATRITVRTGRRKQAAEPGVALNDVHAMFGANGAAPPALPKN